MITYSKILINNVYFDINEIINILKKKNISLLIVHHLLNNNFSINNKILDYFTSYKKIFIVHDYFLFYNKNPNPIKNNNYVPDKINIENASNILNKFDTIYFGSKNTFDNYNKYVKINNSTILNISPDIDFYNNRIYPPKKNKYNICLLGVIESIHKGKILASNIFKLFEKYDKYNFIIFGEFEKKFKNLITKGPYINNNIFNLIKKNNIDYFLYVSISEETYSFTLSIGLKTGLPIIYNNIGLYVDRLKNYENCYSYEENNIEKIIDILNILDSKSIYKPIDKPIDKYELYKNLPEFTTYLDSVDELCFNLDIIKNNLFNKNVCFIHFTNMNKGIDIFLEQINYIKKSGLYEKLDYIFVTILGKHIYLPQDYKIRLIYYSNNPLEWEFPTFKRIKYFSDIILENINILYIHTKGFLNKPHSLEWREYLEYFLIGKHELCLNALQYYNCIGVNQQFYFDTENMYKNHFSGNFWWSKSKYIKGLPKFEINKDIYSVEHYLIGNPKLNDIRYNLSLHHSENDMYKYSIKPTEYNLENIKYEILLNNNYTKIIKIYGVYFICCIGNYYDIVNNQISKLINSGLYEQTDMILCFICKINNKILNILNKYDKIKIISTTENLYEKFAINNYKRYLNTEEKYYLYYFHTKSVSKSDNSFNDWRILCDYFTLIKWEISIKLLEYYDCVGINMLNFPKVHFSGNYWWSKSEHLNKLNNIDNRYLSPEMYICSYEKTNKICIFSDNTKSYKEILYINKKDDELINNINLIPYFNIGDKNLF